MPILFTKKEGKLGAAYFIRRTLRGAVQLRGRLVNLAYASSLNRLRQTALRWVL